MVPSSEADEHRLLSLHVIGGGIGESVVLQMPHESDRESFSWGVIDCYGPSRDPRNNATLQFLRAQRELGCDRLEFLCLTHPHKDHCLGMAQILASADIPVERFWRFPGEDARLLKIFRLPHNTEPTHREHAAMDVELERIWRLTHALRNSRDQSRYRQVQGYNRCIYERQIRQHNSDAPVQLRIAALAPHAVQVDRYSKELASCLSPLESGELQFDPAKFDSIHNCISVVLLVAYGETRIILGADAERDSWNHILHDSDRLGSDDALDCTVVKVSHHGSEGAFHSDVWAQHGRERAPVGVVTPYSPCKLPRPDMLERLGKVTSELRITGPDRMPRVPPSRFKSARLRLMNVFQASEGPRIGTTVSVDHRGNVFQVKTFDAPEALAGARP